MTLRDRIRSFSHAFRGIATVARGQVNFRIHIFIAICVVIFGIVVGLEDWKWVAIVLCIVMVFAAEAFNTSFEVLCDRIRPEAHDSIRNVKDIAAAAVLITAIGAVIVGILVFVF